jgi:hypothetical protein
MDRSKPKIFRHQSGLIQAVQAELEEVLEGTKVMVEKVKSDPPPKESLHPVDPGFYKITPGRDGNPELIDEVIFTKGKGLPPKANR